MTARAGADSYYAGAYWGPRKESPEECARRAAVFLNLLAPAEPFLAHWYLPARSRKDARRHPLTPPDVSILSELFRRGVNRERGGPAFEELGFHVGLHNGGAAYDDAGLRIRCGDFGGATPNSCVLSLPSRGSNAERVVTAPVLAEVLRAMAQAWEPEWAVATSAEHRDILSETGRTGTFVGWVTYLSRRRGPVPPLPAPVRIEPVGDTGVLIVLTPERLTAGNPAHVELARRVGALLTPAGVMQPVVPP